MIQFIVIKRLSLGYNWCLGMGRNISKLILTEPVLELALSPVNLPTSLIPGTQLQPAKVNEFVE